MYNFIKSYSSVWSKTIDYTWLFDNRRMSISEVVISIIWIVLYALPLLPYVIFLLKPFPTVNKSGEYTLLAVWGSMLVMSICGVFLSTIVIKLFSEKVPRIPSDAYKRHPFIASFIFYTLGIAFIFVLIEYLAHLLIEVILIIHDKITTL